MVFDPALLGTWDFEHTTFNVTRDGASGYRLGGSDMAEKGPKDVTVHLLKVKGQSLLDVRVGEQQPPWHAYFRVRIEPDAVHAWAMNSPWLKRQIQTGGRLHYELKDDSLLLTGTSAELQQYLMPYFDDDRAFDKDAANVRRLK